ncbi:MAG: antitoxin VbhA family protein [Gemmatimonadales bacterium]
MLAETARQRATKGNIVDTAPPNDPDRQRIVQEAIHGGGIEGLSVTPAFNEDAAAYVDGTITSEEFSRRVHARNIPGNHHLQEKEHSPMSTKDEPAQPHQAEVDARLARVDGAMGAAGHVITDPAIRGLLRKQAAGEISGDEARAAMKAHRSDQRGSR